MSRHPPLPSVEELLRARVWKVACGAEGRYYLDTFVDHSVALVGSWGVHERWRHPAYDALSGRKRASIKTLAERVGAGDIVLATRGMSEVHAVGIAVDEGEGVYSYNPAWREVEGWDLFHQLRVRWHPLEPIKQFEAGERPFARWTAAEVHHEGAREWARRCAAQVREIDGFQALQPLPHMEDSLNVSTTHPAFREAIQAARELKDAHGWEGISESTIVALIVVPMLRALGWGVSQLHLEWRNGGKPVDVAVFNRDTDKPVLIVEAKAPQMGLALAHEQARDYQSNFEDPKPWILIATGYLLALYAPGSTESLRAYLLEPAESAGGLFDQLALLRRGAG